MKFSNLALVLALTIAFGADADAPFTKLTLSILNLAGGASGASWADYNNDGLQDLLVIGKGSGTALFTNKGDGTFAKLVSGTGLASTGLGGGAWGDFDNDGYLDLFVGGANALYRNNGNGTFVKVPFNAGINSYCAAWADFDNDGFIDLFMGNYYTGGLNALFRNNGNGTFTRITNTPPSVDKSNSQGVSWGDYDNDERLDLFVANTGGQKCFLYHNEGHGSFTKITNSPVTTVSGRYACGAWGDYNNDGWLDLFVCGYGQKHLLWHNNGDGTFSPASAVGSIITDSGDDQSCGWADYDNDGYLDLFITSGGPTYGLKDFLYHNNGDGTFTKIRQGSMVTDNGEGGAAAWGDLNNDGFPDLFVTNFQNISGGARENYLYLNNGNSNAWISIKCEGRVSNRAAIGAKIRVKATIQGKETWQLREISGGGAYISQHSLIATFGLGAAATVELVRIEWPSGIVQEFSGVAPRQLFTVKEPSSLKAASPSEKPGVILIGGRGVTYTLETSDDLTRWTSLGAETNQTGVLAWTNSSSTDVVRRFFRAKEL